MEALDTVLGIFSSVVAIISAIVSGLAFKTAKRVEKEGHNKVKGDSNVIASGKGSFAIGDTHDR